MFKNYLESIDNVAIWPVLALIVFFTVFMGAVLYAVFADKNFLEYMKNLPFTEEEKRQIVHRKK